jgi:hypothetical protein
MIEQPRTQQLDNRATMQESTEMRDFARVLKAALLMIIRYMERRYHV